MLRGAIIREPVTGQGSTADLVRVVMPVVRSFLRGISFDEGLFYSSKFLVQVAQNLLLATLFIIAGTSSHAAIGLSSLFVAMLAPTVLFGFFGGAVADRIGPARGFFAGSVVRFAVVLTAVFFSGGAMYAWIIAFAYQSLSQVSGPAELALVRNLRADAPGGAHSVIVAVQYLGQGVGMIALAPALYFLAGPRAMFAGAAAVFLLLCVVTGMLAVRLRDTEAGLMQPAKDAFSIRHTLRVFRQHRLAREAVGVLAMKSMIAEGIVVALPVYMKNDPAMGHWSLASLLIPGAIGTVAGLAWAGSSSSRERASSIMRLSLAGMVVSVFAYTALNYGLTRVPPMAQMGPHSDTTLVLALGVAFLLGMALAAAVVSSRAALTETAPVGTQSRVFALQSALSDGLVAVPLFILGFGGQFGGSGPVFATLGAIGTLVLLGIVFPRFVPGFGGTPVSDSVAA